MICLLYSFQGNEAWGPVGGQSRPNFRFICGWGSSDTKRTLSTVCPKAMRCLTRLEMLSDLVHFHRLRSTTQKNMYAAVWNTEIILFLRLLNMLCRIFTLLRLFYESWMLRINVCLNGNSIVIHNIIIPATQTYYRSEVMCIASK